MKTSRDPRHLNRIRTIEDLFALGFWMERETKSQKFQAKTDTTEKIAENLDQIDAEIKKAASSWPIDQINRIDLAILRLAIFELIINKDNPFKVVVDEAVELAKEYGSTSSPAFVNGVLGNVITAHGLDKRKEEKE